MNLNHRFPFNHPVNTTPPIWAQKNPDPDTFAVVVFALRFKISKATPKANIWISASHDYQVKLNHQRIPGGQTRSDPDRWGVRKLSLGRLKPGLHTLKVRVVYWGKHAAVAQMGARPFLLVAGDGPLGELIGSHSSGWKCFEDLRIQPMSDIEWGGKKKFWAAGYGERWTLSQKDPMDERPTGAKWQPTFPLSKEFGNLWGHVPHGYRLKPEKLPLMREKLQKPTRWIDADKAVGVAVTILKRKNGKMSIPKNTTTRIIVDMGVLTNAFPRIDMHGGRGTHLKLVYVEAPMTKDNQKGNRNDLKGKNFWGLCDTLSLEEAGNHTFQPFRFRSFRYLVIHIQTKEHPLQLANIEFIRTGFPLVQQSKLKPVGPHRGRVQRFENISWRTMELCAHDSFFDCPHYEQCQFPGDTRVQAVGHYIVSNEDRLAKKAIDDFHASRLADGMIRCKHPSKKIQILPTYGLAWVGMLHDFKRYRGDIDFLSFYLPAAREVIEWFLHLIRDDGLLGHVPHAPFVDWTSFEKGNAPQDKFGGSALLSLYLSEACQWMANLEKAAGYDELHRRWTKRAQDLQKSVRENCWDENKNLFWDTPSRKSLSIHTQIAAILSGAVNRSTGKKMLQSATDVPEVIRVGTLYYRYFLAKAYQWVGLPKEGLALLKHWDQCLVNTGLTTWPESDQNPRSDCHAWSISPIIWFRELMLGVQPAKNAIGFDAVDFHPVLGYLTSLSGNIETPHGTIRVQLEANEDSSFIAKIESPVPVFLKGRGNPLRANKQHHLHF